MSKITRYRVRENAGDYAAGRRVKPGVELDLTEEQARYPLIAGQIEPASSVPVGAPPLPASSSVPVGAPPLPASSQADTDAPARKSRRKTDTSE